MKPLQVKVSITLDEPVVEKDDRSLSQYINIVLKEHTEQKEKA